jgi:hypothetical protein
MNNHFLKNQIKKALTVSIASTAFIATSILAQDTKIDSPITDSSKTMQQKIVCNYKTGIYNATANKEANFDKIKYLVVKLEPNEAMKTQKIQDMSRRTKEILPDISFIQDVIQKKIIAKKQKLNIVNDIKEINNSFDEGDVGYLTWKMSNQFNRCADGSFSQEVNVQIINNGVTIYNGTGEYLGANATDDVLGATNAALEGL